MPVLLDDDLLTSAQIRASIGNISEMTLWRWSLSLGFPPPDKIINRRKFWRRATIKYWLATRRDKGAETARRPQSRGPRGRRAEEGAPPA